MLILLFIRMRALASDAGQFFAVVHQPIECPADGDCDDGYDDFGLSTRSHRSTHVSVAMISARMLPTTTHSGHFFRFSASAINRAFSMRVAIRESPMYRIRPSDSRRPSVSPA